MFSNILPVYLYSSERRECVVMYSETNRGSCQVLRWFLLGLTKERTVWWVILIRNSFQVNNQGEASLNLPIFKMNNEDINKNIYGIEDFSFLSLINVCSNICRLSARWQSYTIFDNSISR